MIASNLYTFDVAWPSTITDIKDTGLAWAGYRLLGSTNAMLSFDAELANLTSNGATIKIDYKDKGQLYLLQFAVLITRTCSENKFQLTTQGTPEMIQHCPSRFFQKLIVSQMMTFRLLIWSAMCLIFRMAATFM